VKRGGRKEEVGDRIMKSEWWNINKKISGKDDSNLLGFGGGNLSKNSSTKNNIKEEFSSGEEKSNTDEQGEVGASFSSTNSFTPQGGTGGTIFATKSTGNGVWEKSAGLLHTSQWQTQVEPSTENQAPKTIPQFSYVALLDSLKTTKAALVIDLKTARFELDGNKLTLIFPKNWNYTRVNTAEMKNTIAEALATKFGGNWLVECRLDEAKLQANIADDVF
jgi:hypothetical protein